MTHTEPPVKVLKLTGLGRSGSTVLDVVLGNHSDVESVGEVGRLIRSGWISHESLRGIDPKRLRIRGRPVCTCGKRLDVPYVEDPGEACPFWSRVRREWVKRAGQDDIESYPRLQDAFEQDKSWPRLLYAKFKPSAMFALYARLTRAFFESIRAVSGKPIIVDSSTVPVQAFALSMVPGIDLYLVHLVRDARGVLASHKKPFKRYTPAGFVWDHRGHPAWKTVTRWIIRNLEAEWVCAQLGPKRTIRLRYEDFVADPGAALERIGSLIERDLTNFASAASSGKPMHAGHNIGGNTTKASGSITLRPDTNEWKTILTARDQRLSWVSMGWLMRRYGYER